MPWHLAALARRAQDKPRIASTDTTQSQALSEPGSVISRVNPQNATPTESNKIIQGSTPDFCTDKAASQSNLEPKVPDVVHLPRSRILSPSPFMSMTTFRTESAPKTGRPPTFI